MSHVVLLRATLALLLYAGVLPASTPPTFFPQLPGWFERNDGRYPVTVRYASVTPYGTVLVGSGEAMLQARGASLRLRFHGARTTSQVEGSEELPVRRFRYLGRDAKAWRSGAVVYRQVVNRSVYRGVDVVFYYNVDKQLEFDLRVAAWADTGQIRLEYPEGGRPKLTADGDLVFANGMRQKKPVAYQIASSGRMPVDARYCVSRSGMVSFELGKYDRGLPLVIDPVVYSTYLPGGRDDRATAMITDTQGNVWITGSTTSLVFSDNDPIQTDDLGGRNVFLARMTPDEEGGYLLTYWAQVGGSEDEEAKAIAIDAEGFIWLVGSTTSTDFPSSGSSLMASDQLGDEDAFVMRIDPNSSGSAGLVFSQRYGGSSRDAANVLGLDASGSAYVAGYTLSDNLGGVSDGVAAQPARRGGYDGFLIKLNADLGTPLQYATLLGGDSTDSITGMVVGENDRVFLTGFTASTDFPVTFDAHQSQRRYGFLAALVLSGRGLSDLEYATYIGGTGIDQVRGMARDSQGGLWLTGYTYSTDFPVSPNAPQTFNHGEADAFVLRFDYSRRASPEALSYSTYLGGGRWEIPYGIAVLPGDLVAVVGYTDSDDFPAPGSVITAGGSPSGFAIVVDSTKPGPQALVHSELHGGELIDVASAVVPIGSDLLVCGYTLSVDLRTTDGSPKPSPGGLRSSYLMKMQVGSR
jgi:hypothetical protein